MDTKLWEPLVWLKNIAFGITNLLGGAILRTLLNLLSLYFLIFKMEPIYYGGGSQSF